MSKASASGLDPEAVHFLGNVWEELVFRAIVLQNFAEGLTVRGHSPVWAIGAATAASLVLFAVYHVPQRGVVFGLLTMVTPGILFALAYLVTGRLGLAIGVHFGRFPVELLQGEDLGAVVLPAVLEIGQPPLVGSLEMIAVELGVTGLLVLTWAFVIRGEVGVADRIYEPSASPG